MGAIENFYRGGNFNGKWLINIWKSIEEEKTISDNDFDLLFSKKINIIDSKSDEVIRSNLITSLNYYFYSIDVFFDTDSMKFSSIRDSNKDYSIEEIHLLVSRLFYLVDFFERLNMESCKMLIIWLICIMSKKENRYLYHLIIISDKYQSKYMEWVEKYYDGPRRTKFLKHLMKELFKISNIKIIIGTGIPIEFKKYQLLPVEFILGNDLSGREESRKSKDKFIFRIRILDKINTNILMKFALNTDIKIILENDEKEVIKGNWKSIVNRVNGTLTIFSSFDIN